eukprot:m.43740 g.43740  ORF g.43740 m.43740 type:complete len:468 (+) comp6445_c0_seq1:46-1449(+)
MPRATRSSAKQAAAQRQSTAPTAVRAKKTTPTAAGKAKTTARRGGTVAASKRTTTKEKKHKAKKAVASVVVPSTAAPSLCDDGTATMDMCGEDADVDGTARGDAGDGDGVEGTDGVSLETHPVVDVVFSFDMTASMTPCLYQVRQELDRVVTKMFGAIEDLHVGLITHGDYDSSRYLTQCTDLTGDVATVHKAILESETAGSNFWNDGEAYEEVLAVAQTLSWREDAKKVLVVIGDDIPHTPGYEGRAKNWRDEMAALRAQGVQLMGVQVPTLSTRRSQFFYDELTDLGKRITLDQFAYITDTMVILAYSQHGQRSVARFEQELIDEGRYNRNLRQTVDTVLGRQCTAKDMMAADAVPPGRFQTMRVTTEMSIRKFVEGSGAIFKQGRGFYQVTKRENVSAKKEVLLQDLASGDTFGNASARDRLGLYGDHGSIQPSDVPDGWRAFVQSKSYNRTLFPGTLFLYENV